MEKIAVLGAGGFGTSLAKYFTDQGTGLFLWSAVEKELQDIRQNHENTRLLPGIPLNTDRITLTANPEDLSEAKVVVFAVASSWVRQVAHRVSPYIASDALVLNVGKGFEESSLKRLSEVICEELPERDFVALSGPSHAEEIARGIPTAIVASSRCPEAAKKAQELLSSSTLRVYTNDDLLGVEYGGALKNIIALCAGVIDGMGLGDNTKAALMTRGIAEISRLGRAAGGRYETFAGLTGIGDLIVTCTSMHSRNRRAGILIGQGKTAQEAIDQVGMTVEGYTATRAGYLLSQKFQVSMPITEELYKVLYKGADVDAAIHRLMNRPAKEEREWLWH